MWQPIETAPDETDVLVYDGYRMMVASRHYTREPGEYDNGMLEWVRDGVILNPTHWMHLPSPPTDQPTNK